VQTYWAISGPRDPASPFTRARLFQAICSGWLELSLYLQFGAEDPLHLLELSAIFADIVIGIGARAMGAGRSHYACPPYWTICWRRLLIGRGGVEVVVDYIDAMHKT